MKRTRVLIVDDSALVRGLLEKILGADPEIEVIGTAGDAFVARDILVEKRPDVVTLDIEMPKIDGVTFLKKLMARLPTPVVIISVSTEKGTKTTLNALQAGAIEVMAKPSNLIQGMTDMAQEIRSTIKRAAKTKLQTVTSSTIGRPFLSHPSNKKEHVIVMGASTGGVQALSKILPAFPVNAPGIVVVIHMPAGYTRAFAESLDRDCAMTVKEAVSRSKVQRGVILIAPGGQQHTVMTQFAGQYQLAFKPGHQNDTHVPGVDHLFRSTAQVAGQNAVGVILTGMGTDGAQGMRALKSAGAYCIAQDQETSVVFGMPRAALISGGATRAVALPDIPRHVLNHFR